MTKTTTIKISQELHDWLVTKTKRKESFEETLRRLLELDGPAGQM